MTIKKLVKQTVRKQNKKMNNKKTKNLCDKDYRL